MKIKELVGFWVPRSFQAGAELRGTISWWKPQPFLRDEKGRFGGNMVGDDKRLINLDRGENKENTNLASPLLDSIENKENTNH